VRFPRHIVGLTFGLLLVAFLAQAQDKGINELFSQLQLDSYEQRAVYYWWFKPFLYTFVLVVISSLVWELLHDRRLRRKLLRLQSRLAGASLDPAQLVREGARLELCRTLPKEELPVCVGRSMIEEVEPRRLAVLPPMREGTVLPLHVGERLLVRLLAREGLYEYWSTVLTYERQQASPSERFYWLSVPDKLFRNQRRNYFRSKLGLPVSLVPLPPPGRRNDETEPLEPPVYGGYTLDISGGGARVRTDAPFLAGEHAKVTIDLGPEDGQLTALATVAKTISSLEGDQVCLQFRKLTEVERHRLVSKVMEAERLAQRKKRQQRAM